MREQARQDLLTGLYAITPDLADTGLLLSQTRAALAGGARLLQYRNKTAGENLRREQALALRELCRLHGATLIINDHVELAREIGADGVHVGADDAAVSTARAQLGANKIIGASCYDDIGRAQAAAAQGADYLAFGSFFVSPVKPGAVRAPLPILRAARGQTGLPVVAIGGIALDNVDELIAAGADAVAVISSLFAAPDIEAAAREFCRRFKITNFMTTRSEQLFTTAQRVIPGGVNSPVRAFRAVGGTPRFFERGSGARMWDADGKSYIDYVGSWGPLIVGHAHPAVVSAVQQAAALGLSFGAPTAAEVELAELLCERVPGLEQVRLVSSGTEATMSAIRVARGYTGRAKIVKFEGCYHGHADALLVKAGSGALTFGHPSSAGVPAETVVHTLVLEYNNVAMLEAVFARDAEAIAGVIVEPVAGNMNLVAPHREFLAALRTLCTRYGALLIFDEVMTGFRVGAQGAQGLYGITADLITLGKVIGGGMPLGAFGGRRDVMACVAPLGPVYQAGTLSGNPVAVAAGLVTLELVGADGFFDRLTATTSALVTGLTAAAREHGIAFCAQSVGGMFGIYFRATPPARYAEVMQCDAQAFKGFFHAMLEQGVYFAPSAFEAGFVSSAHGSEEIESTVAAARGYFATLRETNTRQKGDRSRPLSGA